MGPGSIAWRAPMAWLWPRREVWSRSSVATAEGSVPPPPDASRNTAAEGAPTCLRDVGSETALQISEAVPDPLPLAERQGSTKVTHTLHHDANATRTSSPPTLSKRSDVSSFTPPSASTLPTALPVALSAASDPPHEASELARLCVVCLDRVTTHLVVPCGHKCLCEQCTLVLSHHTWERCPVCGTAATMVCKVWDVEVAT